MDLTTDWLEKLGTSWQVQDMDIFVMGVDLSHGDQDRLSRESLESAARAVMFAHREAKVICRILGEDVEDVTRIVEACMKDSSSGFRSMDGVSAAAAGSLKYLHEAGLLHTLKSKATVEYFRAKASVEDFKLMQDHLNKLLDHDKAARAAREAAAK